MASEDMMGLLLLAAQSKHPSSMKLFLAPSESQGFPQVMVSKALRHVATEWRLDEAESDNLDSQEMCRFFGFVALAGFEIEMNPEDPLQLGKTQRRYALVKEPHGRGSANSGPQPIVDHYLS